MALTIEKLRLVHGANAGGPDRDRLLAAAGDPSDEQILEGGIAAMSSPDRNARVLALRLLGRFRGDERAKDGILRGLRDEKRRVREVALKVSFGFVAFPDVVARLDEMVRDETEKRRLRNLALWRLAATRRPLPETVVEAVESLARAEEYRGQVLHLLVQGPLNDASKRILDEIVRVGTKDEAVMATRALSGMRLANIGEFHADPDRMRQIERTAPHQFGVWYWVRRDE